MNQLSQVSISEKDTADAASKAARVLRLMNDVAAGMTPRETLGESPATPYLVSRYPGPTRDGVRATLLYHHARMEWGIELEAEGIATCTWTGVLAKLLRNSP